jgi:hypothetical protein
MTLTLTETRPKSIKKVHEICRLYNCQCFVWRPGQPEWAIARFADHHTAEEFVGFCSITDRPANMMRLRKSWQVTFAVEGGE